jgi:putative Mn2+ efflux pump MntP
MTHIELILIAVGLSMDAFAVSVCMGLSMQKATVKKALIIGLYFGVFQAVMPMIGYFLGVRFIEKITTYDHWIAFALLCFIGGKMIIESYKKEGCIDRECPKEGCSDRQCSDGKNSKKEEVLLTPRKMIPPAIATSIDALAVGISFAFLEAPIIPAVLSIGTITLVCSMIGVKIGNLFGMKYKAKAEVTGGVILILIGIKILLEHQGVIQL